MARLTRGPLPYFDVRGEKTSNFRSARAGFFRFVRDVQLPVREIARFYNRQGDVLYEVYETTGPPRALEPYRLRRGAAVR